uniref:(California timema) hypothetical protein n=1 Tax=Timema californicum TaxID=61474 RepID=A0A7R9IZ62_TIMCA|nr:unnamed protein product [Timema californicum]
MYMNIHLVFLMVLMVSMALIQGTWSAPQLPLGLPGFGNPINTLQHLFEKWFGLHDHQRGRLQNPREQENRNLAYVPSTLTLVFLLQFLHRLDLLCIYRSLSLKPKYMKQGLTRTQCPCLTRVFGFANSRYIVAGTHSEMNNLVVFLMVLMVTMALIQGTWSAPQTRPQISVDDIGSVVRAILSRIASSGI